MPEYKFSAMLKDGSKIRGKSVANTKRRVINQLKESNLQPVRISKMHNVKNKKKKIVPKNRINLRKLSLGKKKKNKFLLRLRGILKFLPKVKSEDIISFSNNLYILKKANFNNIKALEVLYNGTDNHRLKDAIEDLLLGVEEGEKLSNMMDDYPDVFSNMYVNFIRLGERTGSLDVALYHAREYLEKTNSLNKNIKKILVPRVLQFIALWILIIGGVILGVPLMQNIYDMFDSKETIPAATQMAFDASQWLMKYWYFVVGIIATLVFGFIVYINTLRGRYNFDKFIIKFPVAGKLIRTIIISRFFQAMLMNLKNGMRLQESLETSKEVTNNYYFLSIIELSRANILAGKSWITPFEENDIFRPMTLQMISVGMKTDLSEMMEKVTEYLDIEIEESLQKFSKWLPEITYIAIGLLLIVFMIVIMVPIINIYMGSFLL